MLKIKIADINPALTLRQSVAPAAMPEIEVMQQAGELAFNAPLEFELTLKKVADAVFIEGALKGEVTLACGRCLNDYSQALNANFSLKAVPAPQKAPRFEKETELAGDDMDAFTYTGNMLDLREILQEQVILALPLAPICSEDCKGLCLKCGGDLNLGPCPCFS